MDDRFHDLSGEIATRSETAADTARRRTREPVAQPMKVLAHLALIAPLLAACDSTAERTSPPLSPSDGPSAPLSAGAASADAGSFRVVIGDITLTGRLFDNATARDLQSQLPLTLTFSDLNEQEKIARLPRKLSVDGMPAGDDPHVGDLGYWAPEGNLVLYYGDVGYWTGIMRIGEFDESVGAIAQQSGDFTATVELNR